LIAQYLIISLPPTVILQRAELFPYPAAFRAMAWDTLTLMMPDRRLVAYIPDQVGPFFGE
jgi:hypothetical protein